MSVVVYISVSASHAQVSAAKSCLDDTRTCLRSLRCLILLRVWTIATASQSGLSLLSLPSFVLVDLNQLSPREPLVFRNDEVSNDSKDGDSAKDDGSEIEGVYADWEIVWRDQGGEEEGIPDHCDPREGSTESSKAPFGGLELSRSNEESKSRNESVSCDSRHGSSGDQAGECDWTRKDRAQDERSDDTDKQDGVLGLSIGFDFTDPIGARKDTISCDGKDQSGGCNDADRGVEPETENGDGRHD